MQNIALWRKNEITFDGESLEEITNIMSRLYNTTICIEDESLKKVCYIGTIRNNNLENFIDIINLTTPVVYENKGDTVFLRKRVPQQELTVRKNKTNIDVYKRQDTYGEVEKGEFGGKGSYMLKKEKFGWEIIPLKDLEEVDFNLSLIGFSELGVDIEAIDKNCLLYTSRCV